jgi:hypothetical protein
MSDFPKRGDIALTRIWLDKKGFVGLFIGWEADAILGADKEDILAEAGEKGRMLWGLLNTARLTRKLFIQYIIHYYPLMHNHPIIAFQRHLWIMHQLLKICCEGEFQILIWLLCTVVGGGWVAWYIKLYKSVIVNLPRRLMKKL